jgi:hypothetical protein
MFAASGRFKMFFVGSNVFPPAATSEPAPPKALVSALEIVKETPSAATLVTVVLEGTPFPEARIIPGTRPSVLVTVSVVAPDAPDAFSKVSELGDAGINFL